MKYFLFVSHDANRAGAQLFCSTLVYLKQQGINFPRCYFWEMGVLNFAEVARYIIIREKMK
jgi:hypothetical protein